MHGSLLSRIYRPSATFVVLMMVVLTLVDQGKSASLQPGGAKCDVKDKCFSGYCLDGICAPDGPKEGTVAGGGPCEGSSHCFSGFCLNFTCAPDARLQRTVAGGGNCALNGHCFSGYCNDGRCAPDSALAGKVAGGGPCSDHTQCFSHVCNDNQRCMADAREESRTMDGAYCVLSQDCPSKYCIVHEHRCAPESLRQPGRVADGGKCNNKDHCADRSVCDNLICTPDPNSREESSSDDSKKLAPGQQCTYDNQCDAVCVHGRCGAPSKYQETMLANGAQCVITALEQKCWSGYCHNSYCSPARKLQSQHWAVAGGGLCFLSEHCYSGFCKNVCSPDSPALPAPVNASMPRYYQVAGGGQCNINQLCYSGQCHNGTCAADGPERNKMASGSYCHRHIECFSGYCHQNSSRCVAASPDGKAAPGAGCEKDSHCASPAGCVQNRCVLPVDDDLVARARPALAVRRTDEICWHHAECESGFCVEQTCRLSLNQLTDSTSIAGPSTMVGVAALLLAVFQRLGRH